MELKLTEEQVAQYCREGYLVFRSQRFPADYWIVIDTPGSGSSPYARQQVIIDHGAVIFANDTRPGPGEEE